MVQPAPQSPIPPSGAQGAIQAIAPPSTHLAASSSPPSLLNFDALFSNPLFSGGIGLAAFGTGLAVARKSVIIAASRIRKRLLVDLELSQNDHSYEWFLRWMTRQHQESLTVPPKTLFDRVCKHITRVHHLSVTTTTKRAQDGGLGQVHFLLEPGYGKHVVRYKGGFIAVNRERKSTANMSTGKPFETVQLTTLYVHRHVFETMFRELHELASAAEVGKTMMYVPRHTEWTKFGDPRRKRPLDSVILDKGVKESIVADIQDFLSRQDWYSERGIPYRRGYMLYGPPGTGKSSFIQAIAGELDYSIALIVLSHRGLTDDALANLLTKVPPRTIVLLEDADATFNRRRKVDEDGYTGANVTFSGLLNALDGVATGEDRITFLTTNHIDKLDEALIRPGRVDMMLRIGEATRYQAGAMWDRFYGDVDVDGSGRERFLARLEQLGLVKKDGSGETTTCRTSTAAIQGLFLFNKDNMDGAINMAEGLIPRTFEPEMPMRSLA